MENQNIAIIVQGLFEKSDSIGYDAIFEYKLLQDLCGKSNVKLFSERFDSFLHKDVEIYPISEYWDYLNKNTDLNTIYHYCDGWSEFDNFIMNSDRNFIVRWHNNTPPWFYGASHRRSAERTVHGFRTIVNLIACKNVRFWVNSNFTLEQLRVLGANDDQGAVVYPGSRFLAGAKNQWPDAEPTDPAAPVVKSADRPIKLLFVSRVVAHKGHRHVVAFAGALRRALQREVSVTFPGRGDPATTLNADLLELGKDNDVEVLLKGEVSEKALQAAYASADIFVCFSEHEGFGMPVFEAMRTGVPVICWGRTALGELMQHHPFTLRELDFARAVAAVRLIESNEARAELQAIQHAIVDTYTTEVITSQIKAAIDGQTGLWAGEQKAIDRVIDISTAVRDKLDRLMVATTDRPQQPYETAENLVTVYDIDSYEALLGFDRGIARLPPHEAPADFVLFSHKEFVTTSGQKLPEGIAISGVAAAGDRTHVIFGPYEKFVRGYFAADFELEVEQNGDQDVELELDVAVDGGKPLARQRVTARKLRNGGSPRLLFPISHENGVVEFRIKIKSSGNCNFLFKGVTVRNMRQSVAGLRDQTHHALFSMHWFKRRALQAFRGLWVPPLAKRHFGRADKLRDRQWWNDAADAYAEGLVFHPGSSAHLVQLGNCLKEAKRFEESEAAYQRALSLRPDDQDAHLQIGRLYRVWDKPEEASYHLLLAAKISQTASAAMLELADDGFDLSALPTLYK
jgi:glycosyltransferase involved in cell wall biosynthesis